MPDPLLGTSLPVEMPASVGVTRYVDPVNGNDSWDGTSATFVSGTTGPWKTFQKALNSAIDGMTVLMMDGADYGTGGTTIHNATLSRSTTNPVTFKAFPGDTPIVRGKLNVNNASGYRFDGIWFRGPAAPDSDLTEPVVRVIGTSHHIEFLRCRVYECGKHNAGMYVNTSGTNIIARASRFDHNGTTEDRGDGQLPVNTEHGIYWMNGSGALIDCELDNNIAFGIQWYSNNVGHTLIISGCIAHHNGNDGFHANSDGGTCTLVNCVSVDNVDRGFSSGTRSGAITVLNCIAHGNPGGATGWGSNVPTVTNLLTSDPLFVDRNANDYRFSTGTSPAIHVGDAAYAYPYDANGIERVWPPDLGPYEYASLWFAEPTNGAGTSNTDVTAGGTYTSGSIPFVQGRLYVLFLALSASGATGPTSVTAARTSGETTAWTACPVIGTWNYDAISRGETVAAFYYVCGASGSSTLTITVNGVTTGAAWKVVEITGYDPANPVPQGKRGPNGNISSATVSLDNALSASESAILSMVETQANLSLAPNAPGVEIGSDATPTTPVDDLAVAYAVGTQTLAWAWGGTLTTGAGAAVEVAALRVAGTVNLAGTASLTVSAALAAWEADIAMEGAASIAYAITGALDVLTPGVIVLGTVLNTNTTWRNQAFGSILNITTYGSAPSLGASLPALMPDSVGVTRYVDPVNGNDSWDGTSATQGSGTVGPWKTFQKALDSAADGMTVLMMDGVDYGVGGVTIHNATTTRSITNPVTFRAYPGDTPIVRGKLNVNNARGYRFDGIWFRGPGAPDSDVTEPVVRVIGTSNRIEFHHCRFYESGKHNAALYVNTSGTHIIARASRFDHNGTSAARDDGQLPVNTEHGVYWLNGSGALIDCELDNNIAFGIQWYNNNVGHTLILAGCLAHDNGNDGFHGNSDGGTLIWANCIAFDNVDRGFSTGSRAGAISLINCIAHGNSGGATGWGSTVPTVTNLLTTDPLFVNRGAGDYRLSSPSSPAAGAGHANYAYLYDADDVQRTAPADIGSYEYTTAPGGGAALGEALRSATYPPA